MYTIFINDLTGCKKNKDQANQEYQEKEETGLENSVHILKILRFTGHYRGKKKEQEINIPCSPRRYKYIITLVDISDYTYVQYIYQVIKCLFISLT